MRKIASLWPLLALLVAFVAIGCSEDDPTGPGPDGNDTTDVVPGVGSVYVYNVYKTDAQGNKVPGSDDTATVTLTDTNRSFDGRTNIYQFVENAPDGGVREHYLHTLPNGDVEFQLGLREVLDYYVPNFWATMPFGSKATNTVNLVDSVYPETFVGEVHVTADVKTMYVGQENVTLNGKTIQVQKARAELKVHIVAVDLADEYDVIETTEISYSPKIGFVSSRTFTAQQDITPGERQGEVYTLKSFTTD